MCQCLMGNQCVAAKVWKLAEYEVYVYICAQEKQVAWENNEDELLLMMRAGTAKHDWNEMKISSADKPEEALNAQIRKHANKNTEKIDK